MLNIVIVCYNCGSDIANALSDIKAGSFDTTKIKFIIVDNNSQDNSISILEKIKNLDIEIIASNKNLGFGAGCNLAIDKLTFSKTLFLNPDVRLNKDSLKNLFDFSISNPSARIWGGQTVNLQGQNDGQNAWREPTLKGVLSWSFFGDILLKKLSLRIPDAYTSEEIKESPYVDSISGCFLLMETELFKELGGFDERFFMYSEEVDLCRRARDLGAKPMSTNKAVILHEGSKTITSINKLNFLYLSKLKYCKKHWNIVFYYIARTSIFVGSSMRALLYCILSFNSKNRAEAKIWLNFCSEQLKWKIQN